MLSVRSHSNAERVNSPFGERNHARRKSFVARLKLGVRDSVDREFVERHKDGNSIRFDVDNQPGDIYEIRRWLWDDARKTYMGGTVYVGFDQSNKPFMLTREEAFASVLMRPLGDDADYGSAPIETITRPDRIIPSDLIIT